MVVARVQTIVQFDDTHLAALDQRAARRRVSRSQVIREAVEAYVADDLDAQISRQIIEAYERIPWDTPDEWGNPAEFAEQAAIETARRLTEEEREAGLEPW